MSMRIRFQYSAGNALGYSIERLADGLLYDFASTGGTAGTFTAAPATLIAALAADTGNFLGRYKATLSPTPATGSQFANGDYCVTIHNTAAANAVVAELGVVMTNGDDATVVPSASGVDPLSQSVPGGYAVGTAGYVLGTNVDAVISTRATPAQILATPANLLATDASGRITLAAAGLDAVVVETGVNARQALAPILAAAAGVLSGAGTTTVVLKGGNVATTRITATVDPATGNRTAVALNLPT